MSDTITPEAVASLATKLGGLALTDEERQVLDALLDRAAEADVDVEGYGVVFEVETTVVKSGQPMGIDGRADFDWVARVGRATGLDMSQLGVWTDMRP
ncbi:MAG: hypothetical protein HKN44_13620 [Ilumatobacter sp.]|nr:hypothetical protein [Ilumatobacter sp.]